MHVLQRLFFGNYILSVALLSWLAAQICKTIINYILSGKFEAERMWGAGGMPSAHSALVCSMFMAAAMYDAMGVRRETGEQAKVLNRMISDWLSEDEDAPAYLAQNGRKLKEKVGHTPFEVLSGALLGILIAVIVPAP